MIQEFIEKMRDPSAEVRSAAHTEMSKTAKSGTLSIENAEALVRAAVGEFPKSEHEWQDPTADMIRIARTIARDKDPCKLLPAIGAVFTKLTKGGKQAALQIVVLCTTPVAAELYLKCLEHLGNDLDGPIAEFEPSAGEAVAATLFPRLLELGRNRSLAFPVFSTLLNFRKADIVPEDVARTFDGALANVLRAEVEQAIRLQQPVGLGWRNELPYAETRGLVGLMMDLASVLKPGKLLDVVRVSVITHDPRLRMFRAVSLLRHGDDVPAAELEWIAQSPRERYCLFDQMSGWGMKDRLPALCRDQAKLAEGNMVDWLCYGTELGREPDEIEQIRVESRTSSQGHILVRWLKKREPVDYFFFRFRVTEEHWAKERGWLVGMAGGYPRSAQPTTSHDGGIFSIFESFESKSVDDHVADYLES